VSQMTLGPQQRGALAPHDDATRNASRVGQRTVAIAAGVTAGGLLILAIWLGSRGFQWFDAALIGYAVASVFALAAITYKYTFWLMRPQTGLYFARGWQLFFNYRNFVRYAGLVPVAIFNGLLAQTFIRQRGLYRWIMHLCIFWGVAGSVAITFPLTFGWLRFTLTSAAQYQMWALGFPIITFDPGSLFGFAVYHALVITSIPLLIGLIMAFHRRFHDISMIAIQRFGFDMIPLALLFAIVFTGLSLTADSTFFGGAFYWFISLLHEDLVVLWLISLPFGKFFHIIERPATVGIELYWRTGKDGPQHACPRCGQPFAPARFVGDLKQTLASIGQDYGVTNEHESGPADTETWWQDFCPDCKRVMRGAANMAALGREGNQFL
jgi:hypothetical protein